MSINCNILSDFFLTYILECYFQTFQDSKEPNPGMKSLADFAKRLVNPRARVIDNSNFNFSQFIPQKIPPIFSYGGSLTTPLYCEKVTWMILSEPQPITSEIVRYNL